MTNVVPGTLGQAPWSSQQLQSHPEGALLVDRAHQVTWLPQKPSASKSRERWIATAGTLCFLGGKGPLHSQNLCDSAVLNLNEPGLRQSTVVLSEDL